jgi:uncharacterized protein YdaU (DUF1376 family)
VSDEQHLPWMKLWVYDFIGKTVMWPGLAGGLYAQCLILEWASGPLPDDAAKLASILKYDCETFTTAWVIVRSAFESTADGRLVNRALEAERAEAYELRTKLSDAGKHGAKKRWKEKQSASKANGHANTPPNGNANGEAYAHQHQHQHQHSASDSKTREGEERSPNENEPSVVTKASDLSRLKPPKKVMKMTAAELEESKKCSELALRYVAKFPNYEDADLARMAHVHLEYIRRARRRAPPSNEPAVRLAESPDDGGRP